MTGARILRLAPGGRVAAGLDWKVAPRGVKALAPGEGSGFVLGGAAGFLLRHDGRVAHAPGDLPAQGAGSLLLAVARAIAAAEGGGAPRPGTWLAAAGMPSAAEGQRAFWLGAVAVSGAGAFQPVPSPEETVGSREEFLAALADLAAVTAVAGIAVADLGDGGHEALAAGIRRRLEAASGGGRDQAPPPVTVVTPDGAGGPAFARQRRVPAGLLALGTLGLVTLLAGALAVPPVLGGWLSPPPAPPRMVEVEIPRGAFADACTAALAGWWPRIVGWVADGRGCALAGHLPAALAGADMAAGRADGPPQAAMAVWTTLARARQANGILADSAARRVLGGWQHGQLHRGDRLALWQERSVDLVPLAAAGGSRPDTGTAGTSLAALWANRPGAVVAGQGGFSVSAPGSAETLLARAARVESLEPVRLELPADGVPKLLLRYRSSRHVPGSLLEGRTAAAITVSGKGER